MSVESLKFIQICDELLQSRYSIATKNDLNHLRQLLVDNKISEAYMFVNYKQSNDLEYIMPDSMWEWLINNQ